MVEPQEHSTFSTDDLHGVHVFQTSVDHEDDIHYRPVDTAFEGRVLTNLPKIAELVAGEGWREMGRKRSKEKDW